MFSVEPVAEQPVLGSTPSPSALAVYQAATDRKRELEVELANVTAFMRSYAKFAGVCPPPARRGARACSVGAALITKLCIDILSDGTARTAGQLFRMLAEKGVVVDGAYPKNRVVTAMWRAPNVEHTEHGYRMVDERRQQLVSGQMAAAAAAEAQQRVYEVDPHLRAVMGLNRNPGMNGPADGARVASTQASGTDKNPPQPSGGE